MGLFSFITIASFKNSIFDAFTGRLLRRFHCLFVAVVMFPGTLVSAGDGVSVVDVAVGVEHACALQESGRVWCWGAAIDNGQEVYSEQPALVAGLSDIREIDAGWLGTCAIDSSGYVYCWGVNLQETLKRNLLIHATSPVLIEGLPPVLHVSVGWSHICTLTNEGEVYCWGENTLGEIGDGTTDSHVKPVRINGIERAISVSAGINNTCAVEAKGSVKCWGTDNPPRTQGEGFAFKSLEPKTIHGLKNLTSVTNGRNYVCATQQAGPLLCWGSTYAIPITESGVSRLPKVRTKLSGITTVGAKEKILAADLGLFQGCAVHDDGRMACWSRPGIGRNPKAVNEIENVKQVSLSIGDEDGCAILRDGKLRCWERHIFNHELVVLPES